MLSWQVLDLLVQRLLELCDNNNNNNNIQFLEQLLDRYGHLYKFHGTGQISMLLPIEVWILNIIGFVHDLR